MTNIPETKIWPKLNRFEDDDGMRWYIHPDNDPKDQSLWMPSITTVLDHIVPAKLKNYFVNNSKNKQEKVLKVSGEFGSLAHDLIEQDLNGLTIIVPDSHKDFWNKWQEKKQLHNISMLRTEFGVCSLRLGLAGTTDGVFLYRPENEHYPRPHVGDLKTGFYDVKVGWQIAGYKLILEDSYDYSGLGMVGFKIPRDGGEAKTFEYTHFDWCRRRMLESFGTWKGLNYHKLAKMNWKWLYEEVL